MGRPLVLFRKWLADDVDPICERRVTTRQCYTCRCVAICMRRLAKLCGKQQAMSGVTFSCSLEGWSGRRDARIGGFMYGVRETWHLLHQIGRLSRSPNMETG
jgi:hypothetical protein